MGKKRGDKIVHVVTVTASGGRTNDSLRECDSSLRLACTKDKRHDHAVQSQHLQHMHAFNHATFQYVISKDIVIMPNYRNPSLVK